jgi:hypothetical protein
MSFSALRSKKSARHSSAVLAIFLVVSAASFATSLARAQSKTPKPPPDVIVFTNGDQLTGTLERGIGSSVVFKSDVAGEVTVSLDKVKSLHSSGSFAVLGKNAPISRKAVTPGAIQFSDKKLSVTTPNGAVETLPEDKIAYIIDQPTYNRELAKRPGPLYGWNGAVHGGAELPWCAPSLPCPSCPRATAPASICRRPTASSPRR